MNILIPTHVFTDDPKSGLHTEIWNITKHLAELGNQIFVVTAYLELHSETKDSLKKKNIYIYHGHSIITHNLGPPEAFLTFIISLILRLKYHFDWIYITDTAKTPFSYFKLGANLACRVLCPQTQKIKKIFKGSDWSYDRRRKDEEEGWEQRSIPILYRVLGLLANSVWFKIFPVQEVAKNCNLLVCQGSKTLKYYSSIGYNNAINIPNGIEDYRFDVSVKKVKNKNKYVYLFVGRIAKRKGIFYLLKAFKKLHRKHPNTQLWIIGKGSNNLINQLIKQSGTLYQKDIIWLGEKNRHDIIKYFKSCNVVVDPGVFAGFSTPVLEGMYCKKPVIAPKYGGSSDLIVNEVNGFIIDSRNTNNLRDKMEYYYQHPKKAAVMAERGYRLVKQKYTWKKIAITLAQAFKDTKV